MERNKRFAYSTESPYTAPEWPVLSSDDEADIVDLLCRLLDPVGTYRREHLKPSKERLSRNKKRSTRRQSIKNAAPVTDADATPAPPRPEILSHITLGFNTTVRHLEALSVLSRPQSLGATGIEESEDAATESAQQLTALSAVFVCRTGLPPILTSSLPLLAATAALTFPEEPPTRLVLLGKTAEDRLATALYQPHVGFIGLHSDAPAAEVLATLVRKCVQPVHVPWVREVSSGIYLPVKVKRTEVKVRPKREKVRSLRDNGHNPRTTAKEFGAN